MAQEGWKRRMVVSEPRLSEVVQMYEQLGFEVRLEPVDPDDPQWAEDECTICLEDSGLAEVTRVVYTRPKPGTRLREDDDLF